MIRDFEHWNSTLGDASSLEELKGTRVGIEAADYLHNKHLQYTEPLVNALGGVPLSLESRVEADLNEFARWQIEPYFIFSGLDLAKQEDPFQQRQRGIAVNEAAWERYNQHQPEQAVNKFRESTYLAPEDLFRALQSVLVKHNIRFLVAPYSAWAQLVYLEQIHAVVAIAGSSELLLFPSDKIITSWDFANNQFRWIGRAKCIQDLKKYLGGNGNIDIPEDTFVDACLLAGTHFLPTLPILDVPSRSKELKPHAAIGMIMNNGRTGFAVVMNNAENPKLKETNYLENYRKARLAVKHQPILTIEGRITPSKSGDLPNDAHEFINNRLPDEIYYYLSRGLINARILTWRAAGEIIESQPVDTGDSQEYQTLVSSKLTPLRTTAINLLSSCLHNWYQHKDLQLKCWFPGPMGPPYESAISMTDLPEARTTVEMWNVKEATFMPVVKDSRCGYLGTAILALKDEDFVAKSSSKRDVKKPLSTKLEFIYNTLWRFLTLRDYVDVNHNLTAWGKMLATVITALKGNRELEEAAVLAVELIRLGMANGETSMFPMYNSAQITGQATDIKFNLLISRVAGLIFMRHKPVGYVGPLSQHLLGYNSVINAVRSSVRDLVEVSATHMLMSGCVTREMDNLSDIALQLPWLSINNCMLSIAVLTYLNGIDPTSADSKAETLDKCATDYFIHMVDFEGDLRIAFELWDAVYEGVKTSGNLVKESDKKIWTEANDWLTPRR